MKQCGYDLYLRAAAMLGLTDTAAEQAGLLRHVRDMVCELCLDLRLPQPETVSDPIVLTPCQNEAMLYGLAMLMALQCGDGAANRFYATLYNAKRAGAKANTGKIADVLPRDSGGVRI